MQRFDKRESDQLREIKITLGANRYAEGSALVEFGHTKVMCNASVDTNVPKWLQGQEKGWVTAEYGMLPRSTHDRMRRDKTSTGGRSLEISRLIARSLRSCVDLYKMKDVAITVDCDVLQADGGTRTAAITGGFVALAQALNYLHSKKEITDFPLLNFVSAISVGIFEGTPLLDLCYQEDCEAETDSNFVINDQKGLVEVQGTAEEGFFTRDQLNQMLDLAFKGCEQLHDLQKKALQDLNITSLMGR
ncbi:MAG: ribonuclease PH [Bdellovibrionales bacterium]|nr:ribonuclease PH [Bdellovibrionales bacterium]